MYSLAELNQMDQDSFTQALGSIFEETPAIATQAWYLRPFTSVSDLHHKMLQIVDQMSTDEQIDLICAHPDLGSKAKMAEASVQEQSGVGLDQLSAAEYKRFSQLNQSYRQRFGFPFIVAVKEHTKDSILAAFETRLQNSADQERQQALVEIGKIAGFRLNAVISD